MVGEGNNRAGTFIRYVWKAVARRSQCVLEKIESNMQAFWTPMYWTIRCTPFKDAPSGLACIDRVWNALRLGTCDHYTFDNRCVHRSFPVVVSIAISQSRRIEEHYPVPPQNHIQQHNIGKMLTRTLAIRCFESCLSRSTMSAVCTIRDPPWYYARTLEAGAGRTIHYFRRIIYGPS